MNKFLLGLFLLFFSSLTKFATAQSIERIEPANWWVGMKLNTITLLVYGKNIQQLQPSIQYKGISIKKVEKVENPNYLFITIEIASHTAVGTANIDFKQNNTTLISKPFNIKAREPNSANRQGFSSKDVVLLIVPDRFANGDTTNDNTTNTIEKLNRTDETGRHGGDITGIIQSLDYIKKLGYTQIWNTPLVENDMGKTSYHGYAATDFYKIDPRYGTNADFKNLVALAKQQGIGIIWDVVLNHCGLNYYFVKDPPMNNWLNYQQNPVRTNHQKTTLYDKNASQKDKDEYVGGWFDKTMPDLNQKNPLVASFLIQNSIWWIEYAGLSGIREDTYSYADKNFLATWGKTILNEYPNFNMVGEEFTTLIPLNAYWQKGKKNADGYVSYLPSVMDFSLNENVTKALTTQNNWFSTWQNVYQSIGEDYEYANTNNLLIFPDNHDIDRFYTKLNKNLADWKLGIALYATIRGIPQFLYGTEVLFTNEQPGNDGQRRKDFYGGWFGDKKNAFTGTGLTIEEKEAQSYFSKLLNWRKNKPVIHTGKFMHFVPQQNDVYIFMRYNNTEKVLVLLNKSDKNASINLESYGTSMPVQFKATDIITGENLNIKTTILVPAKTAMVLDVE